MNSSAPVVGKRLDIGNILIGIALGGVGGALIGGLIGFVGGWITILILARQYTAPTTAEYPPADSGLVAPFLISYLVGFSGVIIGPINGFVSVLIRNPVIRIIGAVLLGLIQTQAIQALSSTNDGSGFILFVAHTIIANILLSALVSRSIRK